MADSLGGGTITGRARLLYFALVPAIAAAVLLLGAAALRTSLQIEQVRRQIVFDATSSLVDARVDRLEKNIIAQDNVVAASVDVGALPTIARTWLPTAARETPTVRAVVVMDLSGEDEVLAFVSRQLGPEDDAFRRLLVARLVRQMDLLSDPAEQLRHLHYVAGTESYLLSYWQRSHQGRQYLVVAWHDVAKIVDELMPQLYRDLERNSRTNVVDEAGRILYGQPIPAGNLSVGFPFPTTLYKWRVNAALTSAEGLEHQAERQRLVQLGVVGLALLIAVVGTVIVVRASIQERRLAQAKSDFVANVSHELKTPLASVRMFSELLSSGRVASEAKRDEYLQIITGESERLSNLIDNVLDFAKLERGKDAYDYHPGDAADVVAHAVDVQRYRADRQEIELKLDAESAPLVFDSRAVELAVINIVDNALKYAKGTESVDVSVRPVDEDEGGGVLIRVADEGPGIDAAEQPTIFERFVRGRDARDRHIRGSGIGLALVKHIADSHGGTINVTSPWTDDGKGAVFELYLPPRPPGVK